MVITLQWADSFAREWVDAWNAHDLPRVLSHYTEDFEMISPFIVQFTGEASGMLVGKNKVGSYWRAALEKFPNLQFDLHGVFVGASSVVIHYRTSFGPCAAEVLFVDSSGLVYRAAANYQWPLY